MHSFRSSSAAGLAAICALMCGVVDPARGQTIDSYVPSRSFSLPAGGNVLFDPLPDGRLLVLNGSDVLIETAVGSGSFSTLGNIPGFAPAFGASFLKVTPDGSRAAAGTNGGGSIVVFETNTPANVTSFTAQDFSAEWIDNTRLAVANFGAVQVLDTASTIVTTIINVSGAASAGITIDPAGNLYTGNGFDLAAGGTQTGWVKQFSSTAWNQAIATSTPLDFNSDGVNVVDLLSASSLGFDQYGNFFVGGGEFFARSVPEADPDNPLDNGYAALVASDAIAAALFSPAVVPPINNASPTSVLRQFIVPAGAASWNYNLTTGELYLRTGNDVQVFVVPEPATLALLLLGACALRRRHTQR